MSLKLSNRSHDDLAVSLGLLEIQATPFKFLDNASEQIIQIAHNTILSDLSLERKIGILFLAMEKKQFHDIYRQETNVWKNKGGMSNSKDLMTYDVKKPQDSNILRGDGKFDARTHTQEDFAGTAGERYDVEKPKDNDFLRGDGKFDARTQAQVDFTGTSGEWYDVKKPQDSDILRGDSKFDARTQAQVDFTGTSGERDVGTYVNSKDLMTHWLNYIKNDTSLWNGIFENLKQELVCFSDRKVVHKDCNPSSGMESISVIDSDSNVRKQVKDEYNSNDSEPQFVNQPLGLLADNCSQGKANGEDTHIKTDFDMDNFPQEDVYNVLLLGETGVGKTTFINSCANYVKYDSMEEALNGAPEILINTTFTAAQGAKTVQITVQATTGETGARNSTNEHTEEVGKSRTQEPLIHKIVWTTEDGTRKLLQIIDTPGVNDTRGQDQDTINFKSILHLIQRIGNLHAICILLKPNESIMSVGFRRSLDYFLAKLHSSALQNILFCFTNTRSTLYRPGDTYTLLETYFVELKKANGIDITLNLSNVFCFENDCFRYMCLLLKDQTRVHKNHKQIAASWTHNVPEVKKFLGRIQHLKPHATEETTNMQTVDELLSELVRPLIETVRNLVQNQMQFAELKEEINILKLNAEEFEKVKKKKRKNGKHYSKLFSRGFCSACGCLPDSHQNISYLLYEDTEDVIDPTISQEIMACALATETKQLNLESLNKELHQLDQEENYITKICAELSAYLQYSAVKIGADPFSVYFDILIKNEKNKSSGNSLSRELEGLLKQHNRDVQRIVREVKDGRYAKLTQSQIQTMIVSLCGLMTSGSLIQEIVDHIRKRSAQNGSLPILVKM